MCGVLIDHFKVILYLEVVARLVFRGLGVLVVTHSAPGVKGPGFKFAVARANLR